jgi:hypothetical protein
MSIPHVLLFTAGPGIFSRKIYNSRIVEKYENIFKRISFKTQVP